MSTSPQKHDGEVKLGLIAGSGDTCNEVVVNAEHSASSCCYDKNHRKLAILSIICGLSCIGIQALIYSVKAETASDSQTAAAVKFSQRAKKFGIISIVIWISILVLTPILTVLISYLLTLGE